MKDKKETEDEINYEIWRLHIKNRKVYNMIKEKGLMTVPVAFYHYWTKGERYPLRMRKMGVHRYLTREPNKRLVKWGNLKFYADDYEIDMKEGDNNALTFYFFLNGKLKNKLLWEVRK
ncbi:MAG: hypothetical protein QXZ17_16070 [Nitrososphaerota archaeon]